MSNLEIKKLCVMYEKSVTAIEHFNLQIKDGQFCILSGDAGSGILSLVRAINGKEKITSGDLLLDGQRINDMREHDRCIPLVDARADMNPDKTVAENISAELKAAKYDQSVIDERIKAVASLLDIRSLLEKKLKHVFQQELRIRIEMAAVLVRHPKIFIVNMIGSQLSRAESYKILALAWRMHIEMKCTTILTTNDPEIAMTWSSLTAIVKGSFLQQVDKPEVIRANPVNLAVAKFLTLPALGILTCDIQDTDGVIAAVAPGFVYTFPATRAKAIRAYVGKQAIIGLRPELVRFSLENSSSGAQAVGTIIQPCGPTGIALADTAVGPLYGKAAAESELCCGAAVSIRLVDEGVIVFDAETENALV